MIIRILKEVKEYKKTSFLAPLCMVGEVLLEISLPFLMSFIIDKGVEKGDMKQVLLYGSIMIAAAFGSLVLEHYLENMQLMHLQGSQKI